MKNNRAIRYAIGVSSLAVAVGTTATPANAACATDDGAVICEDENTAALVNAAINPPGNEGPDLTLLIEEGASVTNDGVSTIQPLNPPLDGEIEITNLGLVGEEDGAAVDLFYSGDEESEDNIFSLTNGAEAEWWGDVTVYSVGGTGSFSNAGTVAGDVVIFALGGVEGAALTGSSTGGTYLISYRETSETEDLDNGTLTTRAIEGGVADMSVADGAAVEYVRLGATEGVSLTNAGTVADGAFLESGIDVQTSSETTADFDSETDDDGVITTTSSNSSDIVTETLGGTAALENTGEIGGDVTVRGTNGATLENDGLIGDLDDGDGISPVSVGVDAQGTRTEDSFSSSSETVDASGAATAGDVTTTTASTSSTARAATGGAASAAIGTEGAIEGSLSITGDESAAADNEGLIAGTVTVDSARDLITASNSENNSVDIDGADGVDSLNETESSSTVTETVGGEASLSNTGNIEGFVTVTGAAAASVDSDGAFGGSVQVVSQGTRTDTSDESVSERVDASGAATPGNITETSSSSGMTTVSLTGGEAEADLSEEASVAGSLTVIGDAGASVANAGRIGGSVSAVSNRFITSEATNASDRDATETPAGLVTSTETTTSSTTSGPEGGAVDIANSGVVEGNVSGNGIGGVTFSNSGQIVRGVSLTSRGTQSVTEQSRETVIRDARTVANDGSYEQTTTTEYSSTGTPAGGDVSAEYDGTVGAFQFIDGGGVSAFVSQSADGSSSAVVSGTIVGSYSSTSGADATEYGYTQTTTSLQTPTEEGGTDFADSYSYEQNYSATSNQSSGRLEVTGRIADLNGNGAGNATVTADGEAVAIVDGGLIEGTLSVTGGQGDSSESSYSEAEERLNGDLQSETVESSSTNTDLASLASATLTAASVGRDLNLNSTGDVSVAVDEESDVGGSILATSYGGTSTNSSQTSREAGDESASSESTSSSSFTPNGGSVDIAVAGDVGGSIGGYADGGDVAVTLTGTAESGVAAGANGSATTSTNTSVRAGDDLDSLALASTSSESSSTPTGGTASILIDATDEMAADNEPSVAFGSVTADGFSGASVEITEGTQIFETGGYISVRSVGTATASSQAADYGADTASSESSSTVSGGPASFVNAGQIGVEQGYVGGSSTILVASPSDASADNSGEIYGSVNVDALFANSSSTTSSMDITDPVERVDETTAVYTPVGGTASVTNSGIISGNVTIAAAEGELVNDGAIRGGIYAGGSVRNYTVERTDIAFDDEEDTITELGESFSQSYTIAQNGFLAGGYGTAISVSGARDTSGLAVSEDLGLDEETPLLTSTVTADVTLGDGSITLGDIYADYDPETGTRFTATSVTMAGSGYLGMMPMDPEDPALLAAIAADPSIEDMFFASGSRIRGVDSVTKTGEGIFTIYGSPFDDDAAGTPPTPVWTIDATTVSVTGGELQLGVAEDEVFGIRGDVTNSASLVIGQRVALDPELFLDSLLRPGTEVIDGSDVYQEGNFTQTESGSLVVGVAPALIRSVQPGVSGSVAPGQFGFGPSGVYLSPFTVPENSGIAMSSPSSYTLDGDLVLAGTVDVATTTGALFMDGTTTDLFSVSGSVDVSGASVADPLDSGFVDFALGTREEDGRTIVSVAVERTPYETAALDNNSVRAAQALNAAMPDVVGRITTDAEGGSGFFSVEEFSLAQDLVTVMTGFDTQLSAEQVGTALEQLSSGEFYGSLLAVSTTEAFGDRSRRVALLTDDSGLHLWANAAGHLANFDANEDAGASGIDADTYGGSIGFGLHTFSGGDFGIGVGYGSSDIHADGTPEDAEADTVMVGAYAQQRINRLSLAAQIVYGWTNWDTTREMPFFSRTATAEFDSNELRVNGEVGYDFALGTTAVAMPFARFDLRQHDFDGFVEEGAGGIGLAVEDADKSVFSPEVGVRLGGDFATGLGTLRPEVSASYVFQSNVEAERDVAYVGSTDSQFRLVGVDPEDFVRLSARVSAAAGTSSTVFFGAGYATGGDQEAVSLNAGLKVAM